MLICKSPFTSKYHTLSVGLRSIDKEDWGGLGSLRKSDLGPSSPHLPPSSRTSSLLSFILCPRQLHRLTASLGGPSGSSGPACFTDHARRTRMDTGSSRCAQEAWDGRVAHPGRRSPGPCSPHCPCALPRMGSSLSTHLP